MSLKLAAFGYDLLACPENAVKTSLSDHIFSNYKKEKKYAYELSLYSSVEVG